MLGFSQYLIEKKDLGGLSTNEAGKLHEVLLGGLVHHYAQEYQKNKHLGHDKAHAIASNSIQNLKNVKNSHMYDIAHMPQFRDTDNKTAKELHDEFGSKLSPQDYQESYAHALHGATSLIDHLHQNGVKDIRGVHFTANPKDISRLEGYEDVKDEGNNSDIVVEHGHKGRYYGVSLKSGASSKLNNPGMGSLSKLIDDHYKKITGKESSFGKDAVEAENEAKEAHRNILHQHLPLLQYHFGENGISHKNGLSFDEKGKPVLNDAAFRYLEKADEVRNKKEKYTKMYRNPQERAQLRDLYFNLRDSRTEIAKRKTNKSLSKHLSDIFSQQSDPSKHGAIKEFMSKLYNVKRSEGSMPVVRLNTFKNSKGAIKKGAPERVSSITSAKDDFENGFSNSVGNYIVTPGKGISTTITSPYGHNSNLVVDSSPAGGRTVVNRAGVHVWDKSEKVPTAVKRKRKETISAPVEQPAPVAAAPERQRLPYRRPGAGRVSQISKTKVPVEAGNVWPHPKGND